MMKENLYGKCILYCIITFLFFFSFFFFFFLITTSYAVTTSTTTFFVRLDINFDDIAMLAFDTHQDVAVLTLDITAPPTFYHAYIIPHQPVTWRALPIDVSGGDIFVSY